MKLVLTIGILFAAAICATAATSQAGPGKLKTMVLADGSCPTFSVGPKSYPCNGLIYSNFTNGRTGFMLGTSGGGSIMLSGGRDSQLTPETYTLIVDIIRVGFGGGTPLQSYPASGKCVANTSADGRFLYSVRCHATNNAEQVDIDFRGNGAPVKIKQF